MIMVGNTPYRFTVRQKKREVAVSSGVAHFSDKICAIACFLVIGFVYLPLFTIDCFYTCMRVVLWQKYHNRCLYEHEEFRTKIHCVSQNNMFYSSKFVCALDNIN